MAYLAWEPGKALMGTCKRNDETRYGDGGGSSWSGKCQDVLWLRSRGWHTESPPEWKSKGQENTVQIVVAYSYKCSSPMISTMRSFLLLDSMNDVGCQYPVPIG